MYKLIRVTKSKIVIHTVKSFGVDNKVSESEIAQSCPTLCDPMDCSLPGFSVHGIFRAKVLEWGIFRAKVLEWVAISFSRGSS